MRSHHHVSVITPHVSIGNCTVYAQRSTKIGLNADRINRLGLKNKLSSCD